MADEDAHVLHKKNYPQLEAEQEEDEEETLSLCDLPLTHNSITNTSGSFDDMSSRKSRRSSLSEAFEFLNDDNFDMCPADEIILCGKLVPFKDKPQSPPIDQIQTRMKSVKESNNPPTRRRRSDSLSHLQSSVTRSQSVSSRHSMDYRNLRRSSSSLETERNSSAKSVLQSEIVGKKATKPRWYMMFGIVKAPSEMELSDMKNRQVRRNPSATMFQTKDAGGKLAVNRNSGKVSWRILKALSCKDHTSVSVTTSLAVPQTT